mgnify:CR=1 FL=1
MLRREIARTFEHRITLECLVRASSFVVSTKLVAQQDKFAIKMSSCANEHSLRLFQTIFYMFSLSNLPGNFKYTLHSSTFFLDISAYFNKLNITFTNVFF